MKYNSIYRFTVIVWLTVKYIIQIYLFHFRHRIWDHRTREKWHTLLTRQAREYRMRAEDLGGVLIKVGQFLSTRADFLPDVFIKEMSGLVDQAPPMTFDYAKRLLEDEWGTELSTHLESIEESSVASASIGDVYKATLKDGTPVAIKIQRYRVEDIFHMDFKALKVVFWIISVFTSLGRLADMQALYQELIDVMDRELDFEQELAYAKHFKKRYQSNHAIHIPAYYDNLCTKRVLVMEWVDGGKITDFQFMNRHHISPGNVAKHLFDFYLDQFLNDGYFHADPHSGNILVQSNGMISIIDFGMIGDIRKKDTKYFKRLIQGIIIEDYDAVIRALDDMNFIQPNANKQKLKQMIQETIDLYDNGSFKDMDTQMMDQLKQDIEMFVREQPIQLPVTYAYLGRAISIILGILIDLYPDIDIENWAKPKVKKWFGGKKWTDSIYKEIAKDTLEPFLSFPRAMLNWLENGEKDRQWQKEKQQMKMMHQFYLFLESIMFLLMLAGVGTMVLMPVYLPVGGIVFGVFLITFIVIAFRHHRFIKSNR